MPMNVSNAQILMILHAFINMSLRLQSNAMYLYVEYGSANYLMRLKGY